MPAPSSGRRDGSLTTRPGSRRTVTIEAPTSSPTWRWSGGAISVINRDKTLHLIKQILDAAADAEADGEADVIATPCPLCQQNVEMYQDAVNKKFGTKHNIPVVFYSQLMAVAFGMDADKDAALDQNVIRATKLEKMARK